MNGKQHYTIIMQSLVIMITLFLASCMDDSIIDNIFDDGKNDENSIIGEIVMHQTGGFAGVSRLITIGEKDDKILFVSVDEQSNKRTEVHVSSEEISKLWKKLEANDVFTLPTNMEMLETVRDAFFYEINVTRGEKQNQFSVYAPDLLKGERRYNEIVRAIENFTDSQFHNDEEFIIAEMPINSFSVEILESFPLQVHIVVNGILRDGCTTINEIAQQRRENTVHVRITTKRPKDANCIQVIKEVTERVPLEGGFLPGRYKIIVNEVEKEIAIGEPEIGTIQGKVTIGPLCPVEPCNLPPEEIAQVYLARKVIIYEQATKIKVTERILNEDGEYSISLKPGGYIVDISDAKGDELPLDLAKRPRLGNAIPREVELKAGEKVVVDFDIDTGIR